MIPFNIVKYLLMSLISKIPGFRSGKLWKKILASSFYFFTSLTILITIISPPASPALALEELQPTRHSQQYIKGEAGPNKQVYLLQNGQTLAEIETDSEGKFSFKVENEQEGEHLHQVKACYSEKQEHCSTKTTTVTVDRTPPDKPTLSEIPNEITTEEFQISGTTEPKSKISVKLDKDQYDLTTDAKGNFSDTIQSPKNGEFTIRVASEDLAGNKSEITKKTLTVNVEGEELFTVTRVIDGDTIELNDGRKVRYIGIDAPETTGDCYAEQATKKNADLVEGKEVRLEKDVSEKDRYGRLLRYVYHNDLFINEHLVRLGYAKASSYPPDIKNQEKFSMAEKEARGQEAGLWGSACITKATTTPKPTTNTNLQESPKSNPTSESILRTTSSPQPTQETQPPQPQSQYGCDCRKTCSQMSSCEEAYYQLNTCGCSRRDGDSDGVPCESICSGG